MANDVIMQPFVNVVTFECRVYSGFLSFSFQLHTHMFTKFCRLFLVTMFVYWDNFNFQDVSNIVDKVSSISSLFPIRFDPGYSRGTQNRGSPRTIEGQKRRN